MYAGVSSGIEDRADRRHSKACIGPRLARTVRTYHPSWRPHPTDAHLPRAMTKYLLLFATTEGQTRKIARFIADRLLASGHCVTLVELAENAPAPDLEVTSFDAFIVAASLHAGHFQHAILEWVRAHRAILRGSPNLFVSVSLSAAGRDPDDVEGLEECTDRFAEQSGWLPHEVHHAAGAFRFTRYHFLKRWALKYIAYRRGQPTDTSKDYELTDWAALAEFVDRFATRISEVRPKTG
jgi:menaquinone-dependent protoporphyrinogen oxidase